MATKRSPPIPPTEWAEGFCTAITTWTGAITDATDELRSLDSLSTEGFEQAATDIRTATSDFGDDLRALGAPETESGEETQQAIEEFATAIEDDSAEIETAIQDVSGITDIPGAVQAVTASLTVDEHRLHLDVQDDPRRRRRRRARDRTRGRRRLRRHRLTLA